MFVKVNILSVLLVTWAVLHSRKARLVGFEKLVHGLVDSLWNPSLDDMGHDYIGSIDYLLREHTVCSTQYCFDKALMGDGYLVVLAEYGNDAIRSQMGYIDRLGVGPVSYTHLKSPAFMLLFWVAKAVHNCRKRCFVQQINTFFIQRQIGRAHV